MGRGKMRGNAVTCGVLFLCFVFTFGLEEEQEKSEERGGRIFYVTTTSSVSTVSTATYCYVATTATLAIPTCLKKRRRSFPLVLLMIMNLKMRSSPPKERRDRESL